MSATTTHTQPTISRHGRTLRASLHIPHKAAGDMTAYRLLSPAAQHAKLLEHLPKAIELLKTSLVAMAPHFGAGERILSMSDVVDEFIALIELVVDWVTDTIMGVEVSVELPL